MSIVNDDIGVTVGTDVIIRISKQESDQTPLKFSRYRLLLGKLTAAVAILSEKMDEMKINEEDNAETYSPKRPTTRR